eukprot:5675881-Alexandrium_andersonii.AAC.1
MSASLVGSEMCIRDSQLPATLWMSPPVRAVRPTGLSDGLIHRLRRLAQPVSYTHLTLPTICSV